MPSTSWLWVQSKAIELTRLTRVAQDAKCFMAIELTRLTWVVQDVRHFMALGAIEGNRTHPFDSGSSGCQAVRLPLITLEAMKCLAYCTTPVKWVSSIAFD